ncbi:MAG TPA: type II toxin-antitoxin system VapC family toxin [Roseiarcus sp.]|nr:type II toxin-antitoxin system VapC family toxin [Roseiarcus sp.]
MASYLIDTNVISELVRPQPSSAVLSFLAEAADLWLSVIALHEISFGATSVANIGRQTKLETWLEAIKTRYRGRIIGVDESIAETAGRLRGYASSLGRVLAPLDSLIAATAVTRSHVLATRNIRDFDYLSMKLHDPWRT